MFVYANANGSGSSFVTIGICYGYFINAGITQRCAGNRNTGRCCTDWISVLGPCVAIRSCTPGYSSSKIKGSRSEEHTSELQSRPHLVCRLLLEKKKHKTNND